METKTILVIIALLSAGILITLLNAWGIIGLILLVIIVSVISYFLFRLISNVLSGVFNVVKRVLRAIFFVQYFERAGRIRDIQESIAKREKLGYDSSELQKELEALAGSGLTITKDRTWQLAVSHQNRNWR